MPYLLLRYCHFFRVTSRATRHPRPRPSPRRSTAIISPTAIANIFFARPSLLPLCHTPRRHAAICRLSLAVGHYQAFLWQKALGR